jgi:hypothetical protein
MRLAMTCGYLVFCYSRVAALRDLLEIVAPHWYLENSGAVLMFLSAERSVCNLLADEYGNSLLLSAVKVCFS